MNRRFVIEVLDTATNITPESAFGVLSFAFRSEVVSVQEIKEEVVMMELLENEKCDVCKEKSSVITFSVSYAGTGWAQICLSCINVAQQGVRRTG